MIEDRKHKLFYGYVIVSVAFAVMMIAAGGFYSFGVFLEPVLAEFGWTRAMISAAFSLNILLVGFMGIGTGRLNDRFGPRLLLTAGGFFWGLGYLLMSQVTAVWQLYLFYGLIMGIGFSGSFLPPLSTITRWFTKKRGMMTGIVLAGIGTGTIIMPLLAGWLVSSYGWRFSFTTIGVISLVLIILAAQFFRRDPQGIGQLPDGETAVKPESSNLIASGLSLQEAIRTRQLWVLWAISLCLGFSIYTVIVHIVIHAIGLGIPATTAPSILAVAGGVNIAGRLALGSTADRIGSRATLVIGIMGLLTALVWLQFAKELWMLYLFAVIFGFAYSVFVLESPMVAESFGLRSHGVLFGMVDTGQTVGGFIGPVLVGFIFDTTGSYQVGFLILAVASLMSLILTFFLKPTKSVPRDL